MADYAICTTGLMGHGKSLACTRRIACEVLPAGKRVYTNLPLRLHPWQKQGRKLEPVESEADAVACDLASQKLLGYPVEERPGLIRYVAKRFKLPEGDVASRVSLIPLEELELWRRGLSGPWEYFDDPDSEDGDRGRPLEGAHIVVDEAREILGKTQDKEVVAKWLDFISMIRHYGARIELITQGRKDLHADIVSRIGTRHLVVDRSTERMEWAGYLWDDIFQLQSKFFGCWMGRVAEYECVSVDGKETKTELGSYWHDPEIYDLYDSYNTRSGGTTKRELKPWESMTWRALAWWFIDRNLGRLLYHIGVPSLLLVVALTCRWWAPAALAMGTEFIRGRSAAAKSAEQKEEKPEGPSDAIERAIWLIKQEEEISPYVEQQLRTNYSILQIAEETHKEDATTLAEVTTELAKVNEQLDASFAVSMITADGIAFRGGYFYHVGEKIDFGPYEGDTVEGVDWRRRAAVLASGIVLRLGFAGGLQRGQGIETGSPGSQAIPGSGGVGQEPAQSIVGRPISGKTGYSLSGGNANGGLRPAPN